MSTSPNPFDTQSGDTQSGDTQTGSRMQDDRPSGSSRPDMPHAEHLLSTLRRRLLSSVWLSGAGTVLGALGIWLATSFLVDWSMRVPVGVRLVHLAVFASVPAWIIWRELVVPLRRIPDRAGLAVLVEREHPELSEVLVTAVQLERRLSTGLPIDGDPELARAVIDDAERRASQLTAKGMLDEARPRRRFALGGALTALFIAFAAWQPALVGIYFARLVGFGVAWPQRTQLELRIPLADAAEIERSADEWIVRVARGSDVPVLVMARGVVPDEVLLEFDSGERIVLPPGQGGVFRTVLRSCQEDLRFRARGGDDTDGMPLVVLEVLQPPDVVAVALEIEPPPYTGLAPHRVDGGDADVVVGSRVAVRLLATPAEVEGAARLLPEDRLITLEPREFPAAPAAPAGEGEAEAAVPAQPGLGFELQVDRSLRYRFELRDPAGLSNPAPGLFGLTAITDHPPALTVIQPGRAEYETVPGGTIPLRILAEDDFGVAALTWGVRVPGSSMAALDALGSETGPPEPLAGGTLEAIPAPSLDGGAPRETPGAGSDATVGRRVVGARRLQLADLVPQGETVEEGRLFELTLSGTDGAEPEPGVGKAPAVRVRVVSSDALLRRVKDRLVHARLEATELQRLARSKRERTLELLEGLGGDGPLEAGDANALEALLTGQRRVEGDARALARELATVASDVLDSRLDEKAGPLLEALDAAQAEVVDRAFHPELWRELARDHAQPAAGSPGLAVRLLQILELSLSVSEDHARAGTEHLTEALDAIDARGVLEALEAAELRQTDTLAALDVLLERLSEWDNFQSVLMLTRDLLQRQKALRDRTRNLAGDE